MRVWACVTIVLISGLMACTHLGGTHRIGQAPLPAVPPASAPAPVAPPAVPPPAVENVSPVVQPITPANTKHPVAAGKRAPTAPAAQSSAVKPTVGKTPASSVHVAPAPIAAAAPAPVTLKPQLDFKAMEQRLRDTSAIGVFTKLAIKNQVDDLLKAFGEYHAGRTPPTLDELHQRYDGLLLKVVTLVQNEDATLASSISASRNAIWERLSNAQSFQAI